MSSIEHRTSACFKADLGGRPLSSGKPTILVVEDDDNSLFVLKNILRTKGYRVLEAWDGKQAIEVAEAEKLDLILLDLQLPRLNGLGVVRHLRENPAFENLPIVIMTGSAPEKYRGPAIDAGCNDFLPKPIDFDHLEAVLDCFVPFSAGILDGAE
jgi:two-component system, cell cycle response regulator DivK